MIFGLFSRGLGATANTDRDSKANSSKQNGAKNSAPPLCPEELKGNLSTLQHLLNAEMKCPIGQNQVYIRSLVTLKGTTPPRIALKCSVRRDVGQSADVYLDDIRALCCGDIKKCPAYQQFEQRNCRT